MPEIYEGNTGVYCIRNVKNGKRYVGSAAKSLLGRWKQHKNNLVNNRHCNTHLQRAWNKCGPRAFVFQILERCEPGRCTDRETVWIARLDATNQQKGYNVCREGRNHLGAKRSEETRAKHKKNWQDPEHRRKARAGSIRAFADPDVHRRMMEGKARVMSTPEYRLKMSESLKKVSANPAARRRLLENTLRNASSPEIQRKRSETLKKYYSTIEGRRKQSDKSRKRAENESEEARNKRIQASKEGTRRYWEKWRAERGK